MKGSHVLFHGYVNNVNLSKVMYINYYICCYLCTMCMISVSGQCWSPRHIVLVWGIFNNTLQKLHKIAIRLITITEYTFRHVWCRGKASDSVILTSRVCAHLSPQ